jgi:hypothetical protein
MFYAKLDANNALERYPYTLTDLRRDNPQTSFGRTISEETAAAFNCVPVTQVTPPADDHTKNYERSAQLVDGAWQEQWIESDATAEQITGRTTLKANDVRAERNQKLAATDWTQLADQSSVAATWTTYRQALRDVPGQSGFPFTVTWPTEPGS